MATFDALVEKIADRSNITSADGVTLIGEFVNDRYREVMSSCGLASTVRTAVTGATNTSDRTVTFTCEKIFAIYNANYSPPIVLDEYSFDYLRNAPPGTDPQSMYAIQLTGATTVIVFLGGQPASIYNLTADAEVNLTDLSGANVPAFPADFHDILIHGGLADQLAKMEKYEMAAVKEKKFEKRLSELRYFLAKSAYADVYQGARARGRVSGRMVT